MLLFLDENTEEINISSDFFSFLDSYGLYYVPDPFHEFQKHIHSFQVNKFPQYLSTRIGGLMKHTFSIQWLVNLNPDETGCHDFPYLLEIQNDIKHVILLAQSGQLKLSNQIQRSVLEQIVIHSYFISLGKNYDAIKNITIPPMGGNKRGMLNQLIKSEIIDEAEASEIKEVYSFLSSAVHSQFNFLHYRYERYCDIEQYELWGNNFRKVLTTIISILLQLIETYRAKLKIDKL